MPGHPNPHVSSRCSRSPIDQRWHELRVRVRVYSIGEARLARRCGRWRSPRRDNMCHGSHGRPWKAVEGHGSRGRPWKPWKPWKAMEAISDGCMCVCSWRKGRCLAPGVSMSPGRASAWLARGPGRMNDAGVRVRRAREVCEVCEVCERDPARRTWIVVRSRASRVGAWRGLS